MKAETSEQATRPTFQAGAMAVFAGLLLLLLLLTAPRHGPWFDEFWTRFFSDPAVSLSDAFFRRWIEDVHPPLFSLLAWLSSHVVRLPIEQARLLNLIPLGLVTLYMVILAAISPRERAFLTVLGISVSSSSFFVEYFAEFRSYFTGMCAFLALTATLVAQDRDTAGEKGVGAVLWCGYLLSAAICLNLHYLTTLMTVVLVAVFGVTAALKGDWRRFAAYLLSGFILCLPFVAVLAYQWATVERISNDYWLKTGMPAAISMLANAVIIPASHAQGLVATAWVAAMILLVRRKEGRVLDSTFITLIIAVIAEIAVLLVYTKLTAAITERYLMPLAILSAAVFAILLSGEIVRRRWLLALFILTNLGGALATASTRWNDPRWDEAAQYLAARQTACPGSRIIPMQQDPNDHTPNTLDNYNEAYAYMAAKWKLTLGEVDQPSPRPRDPACPDFYWADHFFAASKDDATMLKQFARRFPLLEGCAVKVTPLVSMSAVFEVTGEPPACKR
jgi:hypothetical protein